jgi:hypothetical protein
LRRSKNGVIAGLDPAIPILWHDVASLIREEALCPPERDRRVKPGDDGSWGWDVSRNHRMADRELRTDEAGEEEETR